MGRFKDILDADLSLEIYRKVYKGNSLRQGILLNINEYDDRVDFKPNHLAHRLTEFGEITWKC